MLHRLEQCVFADALGTAQDQRVVDLVLRTLHALRQPGDDMVGVCGIDPVRMLDPGAGFRAVPRFDARRPVQIEYGDATAFDPAAVYH